MGYRMDWSVVWSSLGVFVSAVRMTLTVAVVSMIVALVVGLIIALLRMSKSRLLNTPAQLFINFFRGTPLFVLIFWVYYGLSILLGISFTPFTAGVIALSAQYSAYMAEVYRSGIQAIDRGQREAATAVGLTATQSFRYIVLPQAIRVVMPSLANNWTAMVKDTSLLWVIGVMEIMRTAYMKSNDYFRPFEFYTTAAILYIGLTFIFYYATQFIERRLKIE
jgi:His/Glu/Gln/Arg/opine family amino acid ABC transporter permease subunit